MTSHQKFAYGLIATMFLLGAGIAHAADAAAGPSPYPPADQTQLWPGKGPIRTFGWMTDYRNGFWKHREQDQGAVVFTGDSLTAGWKDLAQAFPTLKVANRGLGGDTSRGLLFRFQEDVLDLHPRAVVILIGSNDLTAMGKPAHALANIADMLAMAEKQDSNMPVVLCTTPPSANPQAPVIPADRLALNAGIRELAQGKAHVAICDLHPALANAEGLPLLEFYGPDKLHLAAPGHARVAELVTPVLASLNVK